MLIQDGEWNWNHVLVHTRELNLACDHKAREQMFHTILNASHACFTLWQKKIRDHDWIQLPEALIDEMRIPPSQYQWIRNLSLIFLNHGYRCKNCQIDQPPPSYHMPMDDINSPYLPGRPLSKRRRFHLPPPPPSDANETAASKNRRFHLPPPLPLADANKTSSSSSEASDDEVDYGVFDDYDTAPIWTGNPPPLRDVWTFDSSGIQTLPTFASTWKDRGYRLLPDFAKVSQKESPTDFTTRLLPTINDAPQTNDSPQTSPIDANGELSDHSSSFLNSPIDNAIELPDNSSSSPADVMSLGAKGMLDEAGGIPKTKDSYNVFIRGKTRTDEFLALDLEQDHIALSRHQISISIDIDSIIFVATKMTLSCKGAINLHLLPQFSDKPPFSVNPSVYITLLGPPEDQADLDNPHFRRKAQYPLSSIPHIPFGYFGEASQQFNLYIFFPRMIHKNTNNNRAITIMPHELQDLWISEVIFKSLVTALSHYPGISEYLPDNTQQLRWKTGDRARRPTIALSPQSLASLLVAIRQKISQNDDLLSCFGSYFFVLDARGIKLLSKQYGSGETAFEALQRMVPTLDWHYMLDRANGELYLDLGISFHPINTLDPMVGLWRLEILRSSYALMGKSTKNHSEYHNNTMEGYGGMKAETSDTVKHHTHIVKRISYNLFFESIRQPGQQAYITSLDNAIRCNQKYLDGCANWIKALEAGTKRSYGVRDELRASGFVVAELLQVVMERVRSITYFCFTMKINASFRQKDSWKASQFYGCLPQPSSILPCDDL